MDRILSWPVPGRTSQSYTAEYEPLENDSDACESQIKSTEKSTYGYGRFNLYLNIGLLVVIVVQIIAYLTKSSTDRQCGNQLQVWSPLQDIIEYEEHDFDNPFSHKTIYRGPPTRELEEAWKKLWYYNGVRIPEDKLPLLNRTVSLDHNRSLKPVADDEGGYHGLLEVFHQLHCLNLIRQYTWRDWYKRHEDIVETPPDMLASDVEARMHVDHCIEALRLSLMCHADTTPYMVLLDPTAPQGFRADFSPHHKCRNFDTIRQWTEENQISRPP